MVLLSDPSRKKTIRTRSGTREIPCEDVPASTIEKLQIDAQVFQSQIPDLILRSVDPYPYNCVGMIFASRRAWIEIDYIYELLRADNYKLVPRERVIAGDLVLYKNQRDEPSHIGLIIAVDQLGASQNIKVISKWGLDAEFIHFIDKVNSNLGKPTEFYTDREHHAHIPI